ncbi:MAG: hypothetical protein FIB05_12060 [Betaproteobacteria bacterium]|nr:hypothetical protein [Betaproteobacteria bacterium]PWB60358.1 MAG: hypothetical protein C3F16_10455 [Betaproteobacteria bacterium]
MTTDAPLACAFGRALLARQAACPLATMALEGEAERPRCAAPVANANCRTLHALLRERATFVLRLAPPGTPLPHAVELRLQCGGLHGLAQALGETQAFPADVHALVARAQQDFGGLLGIPFETVVAAIVRWEGRPRASDGGGRA